MTNDENNSKMILKIAGKVTRFATINPNRVSLSGTVGQELKKEITIIPEEKYPFKIVDIATKNKSNIAVKHQISNSAKQMTYLITVENLKKSAGRYHDTILINTDSPIKPVIKIPVRGVIRDSKQ